MKKTILSTFALCVSALSFAQFTTGTQELTTGYSAKIDTDATTVTLTLIGSSTVWMGIGFGGANMSTANDMFIWNSSTSRDYNSIGQGQPSADASQSWTIVTDNVISNTRTVVATRSLVSANDYTFLNNNTSIPIIFALGSGTNLAYHPLRSATILTRSTLGVEDFSLAATSIYPNPSNGNFVVKTKSALESINIYTQTGAFVKTIKVISQSSAEVNVQGLSTGIYLLELKNSNDKSWKKVIID